MGWVIREVSFPCNAPDEVGAYRAYATDGRRSRSGRSTEKRRAKRLTHFADGLLAQISRTLPLLWCGHYLTVGFKTVVVERHRRSNIQHHHRKTQSQKDHRVDVPT
ncbi:MAG: hypothetical protein KTR25_13270 [Myxococcales bacterium]|nr:hypothetical protein [Myxococcales bacterium]